MTEIKDLRLETLLYLRDGESAWGQQQPAIPCRCDCRLSRSAARPFLGFFLAFVTRQGAPGLGDSRGISNGHACIPELFAPSLDRQSCGGTFASAL